MALGPIELNVTVTRVQDYTTIKHNEDTRPNVQQMDLSQKNIKEADHKASFVDKKDETNNEQKRHDAKEQGKNQYMGDGGKNRPGAKIPKEGAVLKKEQGGFDFRV
ncbi:MAG: hypothetical protein IJ274_04435 [Lachnospiraceae bacterium]|nr:hypothetical protein [Lachnospiraceae bacterium]